MKKVSELMKQFVEKSVDHVSEQEKDSACYFMCYQPNVPKRMLEDKND